MLCRSSSPRRPSFQHTPIKDPPSLFCICPCHALLCLAVGPHPACLALVLLTMSCHALHVPHIHARTHAHMRSIHPDAWPASSTAIQSRSCPALAPHALCPACLRAYTHTRAALHISYVSVSVDCRPSIPMGVQPAINMTQPSRHPSVSGCSRLHTIHTTYIPDTVVHTKVEPPICLLTGGLCLRFGVPWACGLTVWSHVRQACSLVENVCSPVCVSPPFSLNIITIYYINPLC